MSLRLFESIKSKLLQSNNTILQSVRTATKKSQGSSKNNKRNKNPKHRGIKVWDGSYVSAGSILAMQFRNLRFHPGLNVGIGRNGTLFAMEHGRVMMSCEKIDPDWDKGFVQLNYAGREGQTIYKKVFNVIPLEQHNRFKLVDEV